MLNGKVFFLLYRFFMLYKDQISTLFFSGSHCVIKDL